MTSLNFAADAAREAAALNTSQLVSFAALVGMLGLVSYAGGRVHQYFKQGLDRDLSFRDGYNMATKELFSLATRISKSPQAPPGRQPLPPQPPARTAQMPVPNVQPPVIAPAPKGSARVVPRHRAETGELSSFQRSKRPSAWDRYRGRGSQAA